MACGRSDFEGEADDEEEDDDDKERALLRGEGGPVPRGDEGEPDAQSVGDEGEATGKVEDAVPEEEAEEAEEADEEEDEEEEEEEEESDDARGGEDRDTATTGDGDASKRGGTGDGGFDLRFWDDERIEDEDEEVIGGGGKETSIRGEGVDGAESGLFMRGVLGGGAGGRDGMEGRFPDPDKPEAGPASIPLDFEGSLALGGLGRPLAGCGSDDIVVEMKQPNTPFCVVRPLIPRSQTGLSVFRLRQRIDT